MPTLEGPVPMAEQIGQQFQKGGCKMSNQLLHLLRNVKASLKSKYLYAVTHKTSIKP